MVMNRERKKDSKLSDMIVKKKKIDKQSEWKNDEIREKQRMKERKERTDRQVDGREKERKEIRVNESE